MIITRIVLCNNVSEAHRAVFSRLLSVPLTYSLHHILHYPQPIFFPKKRDKISTPNKKRGKTVVLYETLCFTQQTGRQKIKDGMVAGIPHF